MNTTVTITVNVADVIPVITGLMIFTAVIMVGEGDRRGRPRVRWWSWVLAGFSQMLLVTFGWLTGHETFFMHVLVALAFGFNLWRNRHLVRRAPAPQAAAVGVVAHTPLTPVDIVAEVTGTIATLTTPRKDDDGARSTARTS